MCMRICTLTDLFGILDFYQLVINETEDMPVHARWVYGQHPTEEMITNSFIMPCYSFLYRALR